MAIECHIIVQATIPPTKRKDGVWVGSSRERIVKIAPIFRPMRFVCNVGITKNKSLTPIKSAWVMAVPRLFTVTYPVIPDAFAFCSMPVDPKTTGGKDVGAFRRIADGRYFFVPFPNVNTGNGIMCRGHHVENKDVIDTPEDLLCILEQDISTFHYDGSVASLMTKRTDQVFNFTLEGLWDPQGEDFEHFITRGILPPDYVREVMENAE
jgi:hypothetical protein